jgi:hypothetical protein
MGDEEQKIEYSPDELAEIERITGFVSEVVGTPPSTTLAAVSVPLRSRIEDEEAPEPEGGEEEFPETEPAAREGEEIEDISDLIQEVGEA